MHQQQCFVKRHEGLGFNLNVMFLQPAIKRGLEFEKGKINFTFKMYFLKSRISFKRP